MRDNELINIIFENCESISVPKENIAYANIYGITESISYTPQHGFITFKKATGAYITIHQPSLKLLARLIKYKDIAQIEMNGIVYHIEWTIEDGYENANQSSSVHNEVLNILICE